MVLDKEKPDIGSIRGFNLVVVRPRLTNSSFRVIKAYPAAQAFMERKPLFTLYKYYLSVLYWQRMHSVHSDLDGVTVLIYLC
jgi:hypothetical protein